MASKLGLVARGASYMWRHGVAATVKRVRDVSAVKRARRLRYSDEAAYAEVVSQLDFDVFDGARPPHLHDLTPTERRLYVDVTDLACQVPEAIAQLARSVEYVVDSKIPGAFVECGVFKGASPYVIARTLLRKNVTDRDIWLYDTFEGMPKPTEEDVFTTEGEDWTAQYWEVNKNESGTGSGWVMSSEEDTRANVYKSQYPTDKFIFVKGMVEDTIPGRMPDQIALLRLDTDFFSSVRHELIHLFPKLARGGVLIIDDYGAFEGARKAVDEYFAANGVKMCLFRIDEHVRAGVKLDD